MPRVIGVVTSPTGAVIRDIIHRIKDRFPVHVLVWPVRVQGETAGAEATAAVLGFNALAAGGAIPRPDVLIVARGGGSLEDLWGFNDEALARAVAASAIPVISAVGHETDWTLVDFVADMRAPTPTGAAEMAVPVKAELQAGLANRHARLQGLHGARHRPQAPGAARCCPRAALARPVAGAAAPPLRRGDQPARPGADGRDRPQARALPGGAADAGDAVAAHRAKPAGKASATSPARRRRCAPSCASAAPASNAARRG